MLLTWRLSELIRNIREVQKTKTYDYVLIVDEQTIKDFTDEKSFLNNCMVFKVKNMDDDIVPVDKQKIKKLKEIAKDTEKQMKESEGRIKELSIKRNQRNI
jgi:hypothetical protein